MYVIQQHFFKYVTKGTIKIVIFQDTLFGRENDPLKFETIFLITSRRVDIRWKKKDINSSFLNCMWYIFLKYRLLFGEDHTKVLLQLCQYASANDLKPNLPIIKRVILEAVNDNVTVCSFLLNILILHMNNPTVVANLYIKEIHSITFEKIGPNVEDRRNMYYLFERILSTDIEYAMMIKKIASLNLIS